MPDQYSHTNKLKHTCHLLQVYSLKITDLGFKISTHKVYFDVKVKWILADKCDALKKMLRITDL